MEYDEFVEDFREKLGQYMGQQDVSVERYDCTKINEMKDALIIKQGDNNLSPVIYLDDKYAQYKEGHSVNELVYKTAVSVNEAMEQAPKGLEEGLPCDKEHIYAAVINYDQNRELLKNLPHTKVEDLAVIPRYRLSENASFNITNEICSHLMLTPEETLEIACNNNEQSAGFHIEKLSDVIGGMMGVETEDVNVYVITNQSGIDGAAAIVDNSIMQEAAEKLGEHFYIIPSSRHEVLAVSEAMVDGNVEQLAEMTKEVNSSVVDQRDFLSDNVYEYNSQEKTITIANELESDKDAERGDDKTEELDITQDVSMDK